MYELLNHQLRAIDFILNNKGVGALAMDCGTRKTGTALEIFRTLRIREPNLKMIVIAPLTVLRDAWEADIRRFFDFTFYNAHDRVLPLSSIDGKCAFREDILLINFEAIIQLKNKHLKYHVMNNLLVIDEASKMKSPDTQTTKMILSFRDLAKYRIPMSGTFAPNSPLEWFAPIDFLCPGLLGGSLSQFRNTFFTISRGNQKIFDQGKANPQFVVQMLNKKQITVGEANLLLKGIITKSIAKKIFSVGGEYSISDTNMKRLMDTIRPWVFFAKQEECLDLPEQVDEVRSVQLSDKQARHYKEMLKDLITEIGSSTITAPVALTKMMKLREITSGFAIDVDGNEADIAPGTPAKIRELDALLDEIGNKQAIIWGCFKWDIRKLVEFLEARFGPGCVVTLYSDTPDKDASIEAFRSGSARFLVANPQSAAHGLNLQFCSIQIFFSLDYSSERYWQAKARTHRSGQTEKCVYVHLVAHDTIDEDILECLKNKGDMNQVAYRLLKEKL